jgi:hypothetical protein
MLFETGSFRTGVSLHSHTMHSRESLRFLYQLADRFTIVRQFLGITETSYLAHNGHRLDLNRGWWTPPVSPHQAWNLERLQLQRLGLAPLISLTDHDNIKAAISLRVLDECRDIPVSVEWTVPHLGAELHVGLHNLPHRSAGDLMRELADYTRVPTGGPEAILEFLASQPGVLVVLNHPLWDEIRVGESRHMAAVNQLLQSCGPFIHALEWNGLRSRQENLRVVELARTWRKPVISGGDRHGFEPNAVINVTNASSFSEFVEEIRRGSSTFRLMSSYSRPLGVRLVRDFMDVMGPLPEHPRGWIRWSDRVFYHAENEHPKSLSALWGDQRPVAARLFDGAVLLYTAAICHFPASAGAVCCSEPPMERH